MMIASLQAGYARCVDLAFETLSDDPVKLKRVMHGILRASALEIEVNVATMNRIYAAEEHEILDRHAVLFRDKVMDAIQHAAATSAEVRVEAERLVAGSREMVASSVRAVDQAASGERTIKETGGVTAALQDVIAHARQDVDAAAFAARDALSQAGEAVDATADLTSNSEAIESIVGMIRGIAAQTNLLALNATIEAARAGEAGRGFAVVAQEVKALASQTARATDQIRLRIASIQTAIHCSAASSRSTGEAVEAVHQSATVVRTRMDEQAAAVERISSAVDRVARDVIDAAAHVTEVSEAAQGAAMATELVEGSFAQVDAMLTGLRADAAAFFEIIQAARNASRPVNDAEPDAPSIPAR